MKLNKVEYGHPYSDNSGWENRLSIDIQDDRVEVDAGGSHCVLQVDELWWIVEAALQAREAFGMDNLAADRASSCSARDQALLDIAGLTR